ncbi:ABC transporter ATP-binding protein [Halopelagius longus]|uniref:ABC transporter ATP-binding protein n=1 Tax=Halopelagius longus TaxID=1236180 RepID=A0A1H1FSM1_9EURY|nr:ABC transporter ATP-binding protein [Halopelagius longus]RDI70196.1 ABC transporter ATP-binding protein [Halopelagius longus]SDR03536.1 peptide/nickel transport system ATP-binding protein [Halopelagius longus]
MSDTVVSLRDVKVHFESDGGLLDVFSKNEAVHAVDGVNLDIEENEVVALVGESGCGKTTLGKAAIGLQEPTEGTVSYRGQDIWETRRGNADRGVPYRKIRRALQIIHQDPGASLNPNKRVMESLERPLKKWKPGLTREKRQARILAMLYRVGMTPPSDYAYRYPHQLSGGEAQRVALVRTLLMNPELILADEAISALDVSLRVEMMDLMLELQDAFDTSYLFISHDLSNARYLAEKSGGRIGVMYLGEIVEIGPVEQIIHDPQHPYTQVLMWATPELELDDGSRERPPVRSIDIPDPQNPPEGCRFHTRCQKAREACKRTPPTFDVERGGEVACYRADDDHEYWESVPLEGASR